MSSHKFWIILATTALFIGGCAEKAPVVKKPVKVVKKTTVDVPQKVHKKTKLKVVEDDNYSSEYMYPKGKTKQKTEKQKVVKTTKEETTDTPVATANAMSKTECVSMIGQEKFDKYTLMFGNEASSIKRCAMLKAMN